MTDANKDWRRIVDDHRPRPRELLRCERDLEATPPVVMSKPVIDELVRRTTGPRPQPRPRRTLAAVALAACLVPLGWIGIRVVLPDHLATPFATQPAAALQASEESRPEPERLLALTRLDDEALAFVQGLRRLASDTNADLALAASALRVQLFAFASGTAVPTATATSEPRAQLRIAQDTNQPQPARLAALAVAASAIRPMIAALRDARFTDATRELQRTAMLTRLCSLLH
ncbi:MAG: hypothetical protein WAT39_10115 [Planctomycetota bacterium]